MLRAPSNRVKVLANGHGAERAAGREGRAVGRGRVRQVRQVWPTLPDYQTTRLPDYKYLPTSAYQSMG